MTEIHRCFNGLFSSAKAVTSPHRCLISLILVFLIISGENLVVQLFRIVQKTCADLRKI
jgi:hypothetical protein